MAQAPAEGQEEMKVLEEETQMMIEELSAGEDFDVTFVQKMIPHHQSGIIEMLETQSRAPHAQLRVASTAGIVSQQG